MPMNTITKKHVKMYLRDAIIITTKCNLQMKAKTSFTSSIMFRLQSICTGRYIYTLKITLQSGKQIKTVNL